MSDLRVSNLKGRTAGSSPILPDGIRVTGIVTAAGFAGDGGDLTGLNIPAGFTELDAALFN